VPNTSVLAACDMRDELDKDPETVVCHALLTKDGQWLYAQHSYFADEEEKTVDGTVVAWIAMPKGPRL